MSPGSSKIAPHPSNEALDSYYHTKYIHSALIKMQCNHQHKKGRVIIFRSHKGGERQLPVSVLVHKAIVINLSCLTLPPVLKINTTWYQLVGFESNNKVVAALLTSFPGNAGMGNNKGGWQLTIHALKNKITEEGHRGGILLCLWNSLYNVLSLWWPHMLQPSFCSDLYISSGNIYI